MGVQITAYSRLTLTGPHDRDETCYEDHILGFAYLGLEQSTRGLADHDKVFGLGGTKCVGGRCYALTPDTREHEILATAYGAYGRWREMLSQAVLGVDPGVVWRDPDTWRDRPFFEVINFADNEGCIGPEAAADLLGDFTTPEHRAAWDRKVVGTDWAWLTASWDSWVTGLTLAADGGLVRFG